MNAASATLRGLYREQRLIPFVGAGLSMPLGLPSWSRLIDSIARQLDYDPDVYRLNGTKLQLAEYFVAMKGSIGPLRSEMDRCSIRRTKRSRRRRPIHFSWTCNFRSSTRPIATGSWNVHSS